MSSKKAENGELPTHNKTVPLMTVDETGTIRWPQSKKILNYGKDIDKAAFSKEVVDKAKQNLENGIRVEDTADFQRCTNTTRVVLVCFINHHAAVILVPKEIYSRIMSDRNIFGQMIKCEYFWKEDSAYRKAVESNNHLLSRYHIRLTDAKDGYVLAHDGVYASAIFERCRLYYIGETNLDDEALDVLALMTCQAEYKLVRADCLEFVKSFCFPIARVKNQITGEKIHRFFVTLRVFEDDESLASSESREHRMFGETTALGYYCSS